LENFKSYAGIKDIGPFHKCFSCVVGPNGSGKSNVIDAMLFVFGKRAKKLRLNKVSELIHSSEAYKDSPLQYARVSVHFQEIIDTGDGQEDYIVVPNTEIVVTRVAKRDNSSNYRLNDKACSFKEVATYLESKGIDLDNNRFLILQGEVEMISMMPPKGKADNDSDGGLLEYLEDIIGSNIYVERTNECAQKLEKLTELRQEKLNRVQTAEKEKDSLEAAKSEAEALLNKQGEIRRKKNILYQLNVAQVRRDLDEAHNTSEEIKEQLALEKSKNKATDGRMKEIEGLLSSKQVEYDISHAELVKTKEEFAAFERKDVSLREDIKHAKELKKKFESKVLAETKKEEESSAKADAAEENIPHLEGFIENLSQAKIVEDGKLEVIFDDMKGTTEKLRKDLEQKTLELAPVSQERAILQSAVDTALTEVKLLEDMTTRAKDQLSSAEKELATIDSLQDTKRNELEKCEDDLMQSKQRLTDAEKEDVILAKEEEALTKQSNELLVCFQRIITFSFKVYIFDYSLYILSLKGESRRGESWTSGSFRHEQSCLSNFESIPCQR
jgi:structural maintenance of chromosome 4